VGKESNKSVIVVVLSTFQPCNLLLCYDCERCSRPRRDPSDRGDGNL